MTLINGIIQVQSRTLLFAQEHLVPAPSIATALTGTSHYFMGRPFPLPAKLLIWYFSGQEMF